MVFMDSAVFSKSVVPQVSRFSKSMKSALFMLKSVDFADFAIMRFRPLIKQGLSNERPKRCSSNIYEQLISQLDELKKIAKSIRYMNNSMLTVTYT